MRLASELYWAYACDLGATGVGNIMIPVKGVLMNIEDIPSAYIEETYGYTKVEYIAMIAVEIETSYLEDSLNDA